MLIPGYKDKDLEGSMILCPLCKNKVDFLLKSVYGFPSHSLGQVHSTRDELSPVE